MSWAADPVARRAALQDAARRPVQGFDPGFVSRFKADADALLNFRNFDAEMRARSSFVRPFLDEFRKESGQDLENWSWNANEVFYNQGYDAAQKQFDGWKSQNPQSKLTFPEKSQIQAHADEVMRGANQKQQQLSARSTSWASTFGGIAGSLYGGIQDPVNLMTLPFGASASTGFLKTAIIEGVANAGAETLGQTLTFDRKQRIDPDYNVGDALEEVAGAAVGGAVLGASFKAIGPGVQAIANLWHKARTGSFPRSVRDAGNVVTREASVPKSRIGKTAGAVGAHKAALNKAVDDLAQNKPVELSPDLFMKAGARPGRVYDSDGRSVGVEYQVVEADTLITSHDDALRENPAFPQELQPRDRTRAMSQDQINGIARNLQPERLGPSGDASIGAPVIGPDMLVESGNGRVLALRQAYNEAGVPSDNYRNYLKSQGFDVDGFSKPVLVAKRVTDLQGEERLNFVGAANRATSMRLGAAEQARADARLIDDAMLERLDGGEVDAASNVGFAQAFMGKLNRAEQASLVDGTGKMSVEGQRRIRSALMARAYDDSAFLNRALEDTDNNIKMLAGAMSDASPKWVRMRDAVASGAVPRGMDVTDDVMEALRVVMKARDEGTQVRDLVNQAEMFGGLSEIGKIIARAMFNEDMTRGVSRAKVSRFLSDYADEAMKNTADDRLFGDALGASDILNGILTKSGREDLAVDLVSARSVKEIDNILEGIDGRYSLPNRLARAKKLGFEIEAFHGTNAIFDDFDPRFLGANTDTASAKKAFFFAGNVETSNAYLSNGEMIYYSDIESFAPDVLAKLPKSILNDIKYAEEIKVASDNAAEIYDWDAVESYNKIGSELAEKIESAAQEILMTGNNIRPVLLKMQNPLIHNFEGKAFRDVKYSDLIDQAKIAGKDGVIFKNTFDGGPQDDIYAVFDPSQIRSKYDAFDDGIVKEGLASLEKRLTPEAVQKIAESDETIDAVIMQANRLREQAMMNKADSPTIDLGDGKGERSLDDIFDEADDEIAAAKDIEACTTGGAQDAPQANGPSAGAALTAPRKVTFDADGNVSGFTVDTSGGGGSVRSALNGERRMVKDAAGNIIGDEPA